MGIGSSEKEEQRRRKKKKGKGWVKMGHVRGTWVSKKNGRRKNGLGEGKKKQWPVELRPRREGKEKEKQLGRANQAQVERNKKKSCAVHMII